MLLFSFEDSLHSFLNFIIFVFLGKFSEKSDYLLLMILDVLDLFLLQHNLFEVLFAESDMDLNHCRVFLMCHRWHLLAFFTSLTEG